MGWAGHCLTIGSEEMSRIQGQVFLPHSMNMFGYILTICFCFILLSYPIIV